MSPLAGESCARAALAKSRNCLVPWFLICSYAYYKRDVSIVSDAFYDRIAQDLDTEWDNLEHRHKHLIDREALKAGTAFNIAAYPNTVIGAACQLAGIKPDFDLQSIAQDPPPARKKANFTIKKKASAPVRKKVTAMVFGRKE